MLPIRTSFERNTAAMDKTGNAREAFSVLGRVEETLRLFDRFSGALGGGHFAQDLTRSIRR